MEPRQKTSTLRTVLRGLIYAFPGATALLLVFSIMAYRTSDVSSFFPVVLSAFALYFVFYTLVQRLPMYAGAVIGPLATLLFFIAIYFHYETGSLLPGEALWSDLYLFTETAVPSGLIRYPLILTAIYPLLLVAYFVLHTRILRFRRGFNIDTLPVKIAVAVALGLLFFLPPSHFPHFVATAWRASGLQGELEEIDVIRAGGTLRPLFVAPRQQYPVAEYPFLRLPPSLRVEKEMSPDDFLIAWDEDRFRTAQGESSPNLFLILLDDFNGKWRGKPVGGRSVTPVLDGLYRRGLSADWFYASGTGHLRGSFSVLCGLPASILAPTAVAWPENRSNCLPRILNGAGYSTYYLHDAPRPNLYNALYFMKRIGFEQVYFRLDQDEDDARPAHRLSWAGDAEYYRNVFRFLQEGGASQPFFVTAAVHEHGYPFTDENGDSFRTPGLSVEERRALYLKSLSRADAALGVFFQELAASPFAQNSVVAVVGTQGYPAGEHEIFHDERGAFEEHYRTVFTLVRPGGAEAGRVASPAGQVDVAPTLLRALRISAPNHFLGVPLQEPGPAGRPVYFSQAADGKYMGYVSYPYKYVFHIGDGVERIYHLGQDPGETAPLDPAANKALYERMRKRRGLLPLSQSAILKNRVWPVEE